ncbi:phosphonatase-like hydrolase [Cryptosporangium sp. NPDC048952]|uniref:phosphonatase-like hydrolase n=1 Tax=Cryptosporangium sp. NPDC048952 TaxID=3363961 RepID=UPI003717F614
MLIDLAALDIAGTTVQEHGTVYVTLRQTVEAFGATPTQDDIFRWMGADKREAITALLGGPSRTEEAFVEFKTRLAAAYEEQPPTPLPGVPEAVASLREAGVRVVLTTGFDREITGPLLDALGWTSGVVDAVVCAEEVGAGRPAPDMIFRAMELTGVTDVRRVLVAGDTVLDVEAGRNAGAGFVVGVRSGGVDDAHLASATHVLDSVAEVPSLVLS